MKNNILIKFLYILYIPFLALISFNISYAANSTKIEENYTETKMNHIGLVSLRCKDHKGTKFLTLNVNTKELTINCDVLPPIGTVTYSPPTKLENGNVNWINGNVTVTVECSDIHSGCEKDSYEKSISRNGSGTITISDKGGNTSEIKYEVTNIDKTRPNLSFKDRDTTEKWRKEKYKPMLTATDANSGIKEVRYSSTGALDETNCTTGTKLTSIGNNQYELPEYQYELPEYSDGIHNIYACAIDKAGNITIKNQTYQIDTTPPSLSFNNTSENWKRDKLKPVLKATDINGSGIKEVRYSNKELTKTNCTTGTKLTSIDNNQYELPEYSDGTHKIYACAIDIAGNVTINNQTYNIDTSKPEITNYSVPTSKKASNNNIVISGKLFDDSNYKQDTTTRYGKNHNVSYKIEITGTENKTISGAVPNNDSKGFTQTLSLTKAGTYNIKITLTDKAGNVNSTTPINTVTIHPGDLNATKTKLTVDSNGTKYANNTDVYTYTITMRDEFDNPIKNKSITSVKHDNRLETIYLNAIAKSGESALIILDSYKGVSSGDNGIITFKLKSLTPGKFSQSFNVQIKKWDDTYRNLQTNNSLDFTNLNLFVNPISTLNIFKKPVSIKSIDISNDNGRTWNGVPDVGIEQRYRLTLSNSGNVSSISNGSITINTNTITLEPKGTAVWQHISVIQNTFGNNISSPLSFSGQIDVRSDALSGKVVKTKDLPITYTIGGKTVSYTLDNIESESGCEKGTLGVKVEGILQGIGKGNLTGQEDNFSSVETSKMREIIKSNAYNLIQNVDKTKTNTVDTILNGKIRYVYGKDAEISGKITGYETLIVENGNVIITGKDLTTSNNKPLGIIVMKDNYNVQNDFKVAGNVYVAKDVETINAIIYADGALRSAKSNGDSYDDSEISTKRLEIKGLLFTRNTIGGATQLDTDTSKTGTDTDYILPGGGKTRDYLLAERYDLNYIRKVPICGIDDYSLLITYDSSIQTTPPIGFEFN